MAGCACTVTGTVILAAQRFRPQALTLAGAQLALARELGQPSWPALVREIEARNASIPEHVVRFLRSSVNLQIGAAARMLHENPALAESGFQAAVVLGDAARVRISGAESCGPGSSFRR